MRKLRANSHYTNTRSSILDQVDAQVLGTSLMEGDLLVRADPVNNATSCVVIIK